MKNSILYLIFAILIISCEKSTDENATQIEQKNPIDGVLEINNFELEIEVFEEGGILLKAKANELDKNKISEFGFLISKFENPDFENSRLIESSELVNNLFVQNVEDDLEFNREYFAIAYVKQFEKNIFTEVEPFVSTGSKSPEINDINQAHIGDTVNIVGKNFTSIPNKTKVSFDDEISTILHTSDTLIKCIVPKSLKKFNPKVTVELFNKSNDYNSFYLFSPVVDSLSRTSISIGDTLKVYGKHFDFENERNIIKIEEKQAEILFSSRDSIVFVLPKSLSSSNNNLNLNSQLQDVNSELSFNIKSPVILDLPLTFSSFEIIEIIGNEFSPIKEDNIVLFDDHIAEVIEATKSKLKVRVPIGPYNDKNPILQIKVMDHTYQFEKSLEFNDTWLLYKELSYNYFSHFIGNDNKAYIFTEDDNNARFSVKTFDSNLNLMSSFYIDYPRTSMRDEPYSILYNKETNRVFFYFGDEIEHNFYELLLDTKVFVKKANYPDTLRTGPTVFTIDGLIYMGLGNYFGSNPYGTHEPFSHFWTYNDQTDTWAKVADFPGNSNRRNSSVFVINNESYVGNGATNTGSNDFWKYSALNDQWIKIKNFPGAKRNTAYFENNNMGYVITGNNVGGSNRDESFKYDPITDEWLEWEKINEFYFNSYNLSFNNSTILKFSNAIYLITDNYPKNLCFKVDSNKL
ncbi:MAG: IPT/TIG domain-containing protein [Maribacter litoralis]|uniref:IPT/TIG domain-containing protein n=1 Tax=Maribacter litoralis TaxID=2059726 RepID=UPI0032978BCE